MKNRINPETGKRYYTKKAEKITVYNPPIATDSSVRMYASGSGALSLPPIIPTALIYALN